MWALTRARTLRREGTIPERALWNILRGKQADGMKFRRQVPIGPYVVDYYCPAESLVIELDGMSHVGQAKRDADRSAYLESQGMRVLRVTNDDVLQHPEAVVRCILKECGRVG